MKNLMAIALILTCFFATTLMVGCAPSGNDKKQRIRKGRGLMNKTTPQGQKQTPQTTPTNGTPAATTTQPGAAPVVDSVPSPASTALANLAGADATADSQIDALISEANNTSIPQIQIKDIPAGTYRLSRIVSTILQPSNSYRALLAATVKGEGTPPKPALQRDNFLANNKSHGSPTPLTNTSVLPLEFIKEGDFGFKFIETFVYEMNVPNGDVGNILSFENAAANIVEPLKVLDATMFDPVSNAYVGLTDGPEKGFRAVVRSSGSGEIRILIENPADSSNGYRSLILIFNRIETAPSSAT